MEFPEIVIVLLNFLVAAVVSFVATPLIITLAQKLGAIDKPGEKRRIHKKPMPLLGGLSIFFGLLFSFLIFGDLTPVFRGILLGSVVIVILGMADDILKLRWQVKFLFQFVAAGIAVAYGLRIHILTDFTGATGFLNLGWLSIPLTLLWIVGITNAVNFIDGLDGLAAGVSSIAFFSLFVVSILMGEPQVTMLTAALAGACLGFLPFNFNPAKIFMGDTGSMFLGYMLATVSILGSYKFYTVLSVVVPFLVLGFPIVDTAFAIIRRLLRGQSPMKPDRGHLHHRLIDMGYSQKQAVVILYTISALLGVAAIVLTSSGRARMIILVAGVVVLAGLAAWLISMHPSREREQEAARRREEQLAREGELPAPPAAAVPDVPVREKTEKEPGDA